MALISKIRKNSWLLIVMIALGLGGFILMDATQSQGFLGSNQNTMAEVAGEKIDINEFNNLEQVVYGNSGSDPFARRNALWNYYLEKILLEKEAADMGIGVSKEELLDLQFGNSLSPVITRNFQNPGTGQVDRNRLLQFKSDIENNTLDPQIRPFWAYQENDIVRERLKEKMVNAISKGMYVPGWMAEMLANEQNSKVDFVYARIPFEAIPETEIALSDEDYNAYIKAHAKELETKEPIRRLEFVVFNVLPSKTDSTDIYNQMVQLTEDFARTEDDSLFLQNNYGTIDPTYYKKEELAASIADTVFQVLKETVIGPYFEDGAYKSVKVLDKKMIPDSVRSRHILLRANMSSQAEVQQAFLTLDSLRVLINSGVQSFDSLATQFGQDATAAKGGDLGYAAAGQMVKPFNDLVFFTAEPDSLYIIATEYGVHLVEVTGRQYLTNTEGARLGFISQPVIPSEATQNNIEQEALTLASEHSTLEELKAALASRTDLSFQNSGPLTRNAFSIPALGSGQSVRNLVRWAFGDDPSYDEPEVGDLCKDVFSIQEPEKFYVSSFVVAGLKSVQKAGLPSLASVKDDIEAAVITQKRTEMIRAKIAEGSSLTAVASQFGVQADTARNVAFSSGYIAAINANEPKVVAKAFQLDVNATSGAIEGNSGVFVITPIYKPAVSAAPNLDLTRTTLSTTLRSQVQSRLVEYLKERQGVEDYRARFY